MGTEKRLILFVVLSAVILVGQSFVLRWMQGPPPPHKPVAAVDADQPPDAAPEAADPLQPAGQPPGAESQQPPAQDELAPATESAPDRKWLTLGSLDPDSPYRMLVTLTNVGAALERIELNSPRTRDIDDLSGYLGHLALENVDPGGARVQVVGPGTPAEAAGVQVGDIVVALDGAPVATAGDLPRLLSKSKPGAAVKLEVRRGQDTQALSVKLMRRPLEVVRPEALDPPSLLTTLYSVDNQRLDDESAELAGLSLKSDAWELAEQTPDRLVFERTLTKYGLVVRKRFMLEPSAADKGNVQAQKANPGYHLTFDIEIKNVGQKPRSVSYLLEGPNGLPTEGEWYSQKMKIGRDWSGAGLRDIAVAFNHNGRSVPDLIGCRDLAAGEDNHLWLDTQRLVYLGVDAQYFAAILLPEGKDNLGVTFARSMPIMVGRVPEDKAKHHLVNTSCRMVSVPVELAPGGESLVQRFRLFAGPKKPEVLSQYGLDELLYYGWFTSVSKFLLVVLDLFYGIVRNYGVAIVLLTVLVRLCVYPLSRAQTLNALRMQQLQPEIKKLQEKFKNNLEARSKAQQDLFRQHGYNPFSGCLPMFVQLPIFIGLYRALSVNVNLRQAPLLGEAVRWCSNLAAPDMLFRWDAFMPQLVVNWLGPYFNILPMITVALFIVQQKLLMPPPTDEQTRMQAQMMQYMMVFMGVMFFTVPSGLCIYFIASSLWGLAERKLLPKPTLSSADGPAKEGLWAKLMKAAAQAQNGSSDHGEKRPRSRR